MNNDLFIQILEFVENERWEGTYDRNTELYRDLKLWGDDAYEFIVEFGKRFNVDISEFDFNKYFYPEGDRILPTLINFMSGRKPLGKMKITLGDLEKSIFNKKLV